MMGEGEGWRRRGRRREERASAAKVRVFASRGGIWGFVQCQGVGKYPKTLGANLKVHPDKVAGSYSRTAFDFCTL